MLTAKTSQMDTPAAWVTPRKAADFDRPAPPGRHDPAMLDRDEFNFSVGLRFGEATVAEVRRMLVNPHREQHDRQPAAA